MPQRCAGLGGYRRPKEKAAVPLDAQMMDKLTALAHLLNAFPRSKGLWRCKVCNACLGALDLQGGLLGVATFGHEVECWYDEYDNLVPHTIGLVLTSQQTKDRHEIKCEYCGVVNRWRRAG